MSSGNAASRLFALAVQATGAAAHSRSSFLANRLQLEASKLKFNVSPRPAAILLGRHPRLVGLNRLIRRHQRELRGLCSDEAWRTYLLVEDLTTELTFSLADLLLKLPR